MRKTNSRRPTRRRRALLGHGIERLESRELLAISVVSSPFDPWGTGNAESLANPGAVSADGRYVVFESAASDLIAADGNSLRDVFLRDLQTGVTSRASARIGGALRITS